MAGPCFSTLELGHLEVLLKADYIPASTLVIFKEWSKANTYSESFTKPLATQCCYTKDILANKLRMSYSVFSWCKSMLLNSLFNSKELNRTLLLQVFLLLGFSRVCWPNHCVWFFRLFAVLHVFSLLNVFNEQYISHTTCVFNACEKYLGIAYCWSLISVVY